MLSTNIIYLVRNNFNFIERTFLGTSRLTYTHKKETFRKPIFSYC